MWRLAFRLDGKPQQISFGPYPALYLADARKKRDAYKAELLVGIDPRKPKKRDSVTFEQASNEYWDGRNDLSATYRAKSEAAVRRHLLPMIGSIISPP